MPRLQRPSPAPQSAPRGDGLPGLQAWLRDRQGRNGDATPPDQAVSALVQEVARLQSELQAAHEVLSDLRTLTETLTASPHTPATFLGMAEVGGRRSALVAHGNLRRVVAVADDPGLQSLSIGDLVVLSAESNVLLARSPFTSGESGQTARFDRYLDDGTRAVLRYRDEEIVVVVSTSLRDQTLRAGDLVRWDTNAAIVLERIARHREDRWLMEEVPTETFQDIAGMDDIVRLVTTRFPVDPVGIAMADRYSLPRPKSLLLCGPPGCGKTLLARAFAHWTGVQSPSGRSRFIHVRPGGLGSPYYSQTEANIRELFSAARAAGEHDPDTPVVILIDEVDSIGATRGESLHRVDDRVLQSLMVELNSLKASPSLVVVAATNRADALDPGLLRPGRLGDVIVDVPRPNRAGAEAILSRYLPHGLPYTCGALPGSEARLDLIASAVSRIYARSASGEVAVLHARDGRRLPLHGNQLVSGARLESIAGAALRLACVRELETGRSGITLDDLIAAVDEELSAATRVLTPYNCRRHIEGLPQDLDIVRVEIRDRAA